MARATAIGPSEQITNGGATTIELSHPYIAQAELVGVTDILWHRWNVQAVAEKGRAAKGSAAKKTDDLESYVWRNDKNELCLPGEYVRQSLIHAAKFRQDPRSPRKSAVDLFKAGVISLTKFASLRTKVWDYEFYARVQVQRNGVTRVRPAMKEGWSATVELLVNLPEYISPNVLHEVLTNAGRLIGVGDYRPTYGRFAVRGFEVLHDR